MLKKQSVLLIVPAYNEEKNILKVYNSIIDYNKKHKTSYDVIVINDGSKDCTEQVLIENDIPHIRLINNLGIGGAVQTGYKYALDKGYDIAIQFDGDGQHDINYVKNIADPVIDGTCDMCIGSRFIQGKSDGFRSSKFRRIGIRIISFAIKLKTRKKIYDTTSGFRAINKDVMKLYSYRYPVEYPEPISTVNALLSGYVVHEVQVKMKPRQAGVSSISTLKSVYYMINVILSILLHGKKVR